LNDDVLLQQNFTSLEPRAPLNGDSVEDLVTLGIQALADTWAEKSPDAIPSEEGLRSMVERAAKSVKGRVEVPSGDLQALVSAAMSRPALSMGIDYSRRQVARWFEVPLDDFDSMPMSNLQPDILFRHIFHEKKIADWFRDWGYTVSIGEELEGSEGTDFIPDVYAELSTLHGRFQVAVTLFCGMPPNTYRVLGMLENIEAFTQRALDFSERDIYMLVTPFNFLEQASSHIRIQGHQEKYYVVPVEGNDLEDLEHARDSRGRMERLQEIVRRAAGKEHEAFF
jgi:hypothetical protein